MVRLACDVLKLFHHLHTLLLIPLKRPHVLARLRNLKIEYILILQNVIIRLLYALLHILELVKVQKLSLQHIAL